jgi:catechol 2,3-dioxygenase-like lactoylglutathione lyase family enzyme
MRYVHTNLVARDWRALARFYQEAFGCQPISPEREQHAEWVGRGVGVPGLRLRGVHLRLPGYGEDGPTLEIYTYEPLLDAPAPEPNRPGFGHLAFAVDDVVATAERVLACGGRPLGDVTSARVEGVGTLEFVYVRDPEGNVLELQRWS